MSLDQIPELQEAFLKAKENRMKAYAPYSHYHVVAVLKCRSQKDLFLGVNLENASFGATVCAERNVLAAARVHLGEFEPEFLLVMTRDRSAPCGLCLQVLTEFCKPDFPVYLADEDGIQAKKLLRELIPFSFTKFEPDISEMEPD